MRGRGRALPERSETAWRHIERLLGPAAPPALTVLPVTVSPLVAMPSLLDLPRPAFLDSSRIDPITGRYSYLTADPFLVLRSWGGRLELTTRAGRVVLEADPFDVLRLLLRRYPVAPPPGLPPFVGGAIGYFGYDLGRLLEQLPVRAVDDLALPELDLGFYDWVLAADHVYGRNWLVSTGLPDGGVVAATTRLAAIQDRLAGPCPAPPEPSQPPRCRMRSTISRADYLQAIRRAQDYLADGHIYQVNLSQRLDSPWTGPTWPLYERLRAVSPVSFGAYLDLGGGVTILSASPEQFLQLDGDRVATRPIKGTRPRGVTREQDDALRVALLASEKDRAEHLMIVDLLRNDLGKVCRFGSVEVADLLALEGYRTVWHLASTIRGRLRPGLDAIDLLRAAFPGGSVTGCPKRRAMEIIEELEPMRRGVYCGAIGSASFGGALHTSIAIRTLVVAKGVLHLQVGGAVVVDSEAEAEYAETLAKARAGLLALDAELEER